MAVLSSVLLLGSILLSYAENGYALALPSTNTQTITAVPQVAMESSKPNNENNTPIGRPSETPTLTPNPDCIPPEGYVVYKIKPGDTLASLAHRFSSSEKAILKASCFKTEGSFSLSLAAGSVLFVPEVQATEVEETCSGAPYGWESYSVRSGDTLFTLALVTMVTIAELQAANCMEDSTEIIIGQLLQLPFIPYSTPVLTAVYPPTVTPSATTTPTPFILQGWTPVTAPTKKDTAVATSSPSPTASNAPAIQLPADTLLPAVTNTPVPPPTNTPVPPLSETAVPLPIDMPITMRKQNTPDSPEATVVFGQLLYLPFRTLL